MIPGSSDEGMYSDLTRAPYLESRTSSIHSEYVKRQRTNSNCKTIQTDTGSVLWASGNPLCMYDEEIRLLHAIFLDSIESVPIQGIVFFRLHLWKFHSMHLRQIVLRQDDLDY